MKNRRVLSYILIAVMLFATNSIGTVEAVPAQTDSQNETKVYSTATISDNFVDNHVLVVFRNEVSLKFEAHTTSDFLEISCKNVTEINPGTKEKNKEAITAQKDALSKGLGAAENQYAENVRKYNKIVCIELEEHSKAGVLSAIEKLEKRDDVLYAGPDFIYTACSTTPNDPYYSQQWGHTNIGLQNAWDITTGSSSVVVGVLDSGIDRTHPDLTNNIAVSYCKDFLTGNTGTAACVDPFGHGTHVAGIIAARGNNSVGVSGVCWNIKLASLRVFDHNGYVTTGRFVQAVDYANYYDIPILNYSGGFGTQIDLAAAEIIETYAGLLICSAGNDGQDTDHFPHTPSTFNYPNIIAVGNSTTANQRYSRSNYGNTTVDLFAPGEDIISCFPVSQCTAGTCNGDNKGTHIANGYHKMTGTSMAAPYVTGVAALLLSKNPNINLCEIKSTIMDTVTQSAAFANICVSGGRLNAYQALTNIQNHTINFNFEDYYQHIGYCTNDACAFDGEFYFECHHIDYEEYSDGEHLRRCIDNCGCEELTPHSWSFSGMYCLDCFYVIENED